MNLYVYARVSVGRIKLVNREGTSCYSQTLVKIFFRFFIFSKDLYKLGHRLQLQ